MDNEIKEMLEDSICCKYELHTSEKKTLLNYITKLQEENEELKDKLDIFMLSNKTKQETIDKFRKRIDKAIEHIEESLYILKGDSDIPILTGNVRNRYLKPVLDILRGEK